MNQNILKFMLLITLCAVSYEALAQKLVVNGVVKDKTTGQPIIGATVVEVGENDRFLNGTTTDVNGGFTLTVSKKTPKLRVSFIGYDNSESNVVVGNKADFLLSESSVSVETVTVTADRSSANTMMPISARDMSTTVVRIGTKDLVDAPVASIEEMLQGRLSGVDITGGNGDPGAGLSIKIRGTSSLNPNAKPLIVVDGIPYETTIADGFDFSKADDQEIGTMLDISPTDIETIEVLKDAAAAAVWGSQGANGVILISTKRGARGTTKFEVSYKTSVAFRPQEMPMLSGDQYVMLQKEGIFNAKGEYGSGNFKQLDFDRSWYNYHNFAQNTDWLDVITQTGLTNEANVSLSGGGEKSRYRASVGYFNQRGNMIGTALKRLNTRINLDYNVSSKLRFYADFSYILNDNDKTYQGPDGVAVRAASYRKMPNMAVYEFDAQGNMSNQYFAPYTDNYQSSGTVSYNPLALAREAINNATSNRVNTKLSLNYKLLRDVTINVDASLDIHSVKSNTTLPGIATGAKWNEALFNQTSELDEEAIRIQTFSKLIYQPKLGSKHRLTALLSFSTFDSQNISSQVRINGLPSYGIIDGSVDGRIGRVAASSVRMRNLAALANVNYVLADKYIITASLRTDGDSRFGSEHRWGYFPSVSLAWRLSSENFMKGANFIDDLKIRASYGENGQAPSSKYSHYTRYTVGNSYIDSDLQSITAGNIQLKNLRWETTIQKNVGFDYSLFENKVFGSFEVYSKSSMDVIFDGVSIPSSSGFGSLQHMNWGIIDNKGWEFFVNASVFKNKKWDISVNFNIAQNKNVVSNIPENFATEQFQFNNGVYAKRIENNQPIGSFYGFRYNGVYSTAQDAVVKDRNGNVVYDLITGIPLPVRAGSSTGYQFRAGDAIYEDMNNDGVIDKYDVTYLGNSNPLFIGGFGFNVKYKKLSVGTFFHYKYDYDVINRALMNAENMYTRDNQSTSTLRRWRKSGDVTDIPRALNNMGYNWLGSDRFVEDASFIRLKSINVSYVFDGKALKKVGLTNLRLFATIYNPFTWTKYTGQDPEISMSGNNVFETGVDNARTPASKSVMFGINVSF